MAVLKMGGMGMHPNKMVRCMLLLLISSFVYYFTVRFAHLVMNAGERPAKRSKVSVQGTLPPKVPQPALTLAGTTVERVSQATHKMVPRITMLPSALATVATDPRVFSGRKIHRIVHLDLKGAPPNIEYLRKIIPRFREWGATGLLIEYEDMFPYWGSLAILSRSNAYNASTIAEILRLAEENGLLVIPLIQTFGHFEFVLKHDQFRHIREVDNKLKNLNPAHKDSFPLVKQMIDQMLSRHPNVKYLHIGCDEVYFLGLSRESMTMMREKFLDEKSLFMYHVMRILHYIHDTYPAVKPIMWDDMIRKMDSFQLKRNNFAKLVEPMVWLYVPQVEKRFHTAFWDNYAQVFDHIWTASAFKGATGQAQYVVDIEYHLQNQKNWLKVMAKTHGKHYPKMKFRGIALTGWQRYDHMLPLCELLAVSIPSLAACLHCITEGSFSGQVHRRVSTTLHCQSPLNLLPATEIEAHAKCSFPGSEIYNAVADLKITRQHLEKFARWNVRNVPNRDLLRRRILTHLRSMPPILLEVYDRDTVQEFMQTQVVNGMGRMTDMRREAQSTLLELYPWMRRPHGQMWVFLVYVTLSCLCVSLLIFLTLRLRRLQRYMNATTLMTSQLPPSLSSHAQYSYNSRHVWT